MSRITWDALGERIYEIGLDHGVLYLQGDDDDDDGYSVGVPWNGLKKVTNPMLNDDSTPLYYGSTVMGSSYTPGAYSGTIEALTYPEEFERCIGISDVRPGIGVSRQDVSTFGLSYRTLIGNDTEGTDKGYTIHLLYNLRIPKFTKTYTTMSDSLDIEPLSWEYEAFPESINYEDMAPVYHMAVDSVNTPAGVIKWIEDMLYGTETTEARLPSPEEIIQNYYTYYDIWHGYPSTGIAPSEHRYPIAPPEPEPEP